MLLYDLLRHSGAIVLDFEYSLIRIPSDLNLSDVLNSAPKMMMLQAYHASMAFCANSRTTTSTLLYSVWPVSISRIFFFTGQTVQTGNFSESTPRPGCFPGRYAGQWKIYCRAVVILFLAASAHSRFWRNCVSQYAKYAVRAKNPGVSMNRA